MALSEGIHTYINAYIHKLFQKWLAARFRVWPSAMVDFKCLLQTPSGANLYLFSIHRDSLHILLQPCLADFIFWKRHIIWRDHQFEEGQYIQALGQDDLWLYVNTIIYGFRIKCNWNWYDFRSLPNGFERWDHLPRPIS